MGWRTGSRSFFILERTCQVGCEKAKVFRGRGKRKEKKKRSAKSVEGAKKGANRGEGVEWQQAPFPGCRKHQSKKWGSAATVQCRARQYRVPAPAPARVPVPVSSSKCWEQGKCTMVTVGSCSTAAIARDREDGQWRVEPEALSGGIARCRKHSTSQARTGGQVLQRDAERRRETAGRGLG